MEVAAKLVITNKATCILFSKSIVIFSISVSHILDLLVSSLHENKMIIINYLLDLLSTNVTISTKTTTQVIKKIFIDLISLIINSKEQQK